MQQLEVWAIDEMVEATEAQLCETEAERSSQPKAVEQRCTAQEQCPLARAGCVCVVQECEWCDEEQRGRVQPNEPGVVRGVAGVGKRPVSEQHMPNLVSGAGESKARGETTKGQRSKMRPRRALTSTTFAKAWQWSGLQRRARHSKTSSVGSTCRQRGATWRG